MLKRVNVNSHLNCSTGEKLQGEINHTYLLSIR